MEPPLHPAIVHIPIGLAMILPLAALVLAVGFRQKWFDKKTWALLVALQAVTFGGGLLAMNTGEEEEERVEDVVSERLIEEHEEKAETFVWTAGGALALSAGVLFLPVEGPALIAGAAAVTLANAVAAGAIYLAGKAGGELVYQHGAASAYASAPGEGGELAHERGSRGHDDDDDSDGE